MEDVSLITILRFLVPQLPFIAKTTIWHTLSLSPTSTKWDLKTALLINLSRKAFRIMFAYPISKQQAITLTDPGIKGKLWVSKITLPVPEEEEDDIRKVLLSAVDGLMMMKQGGEEEEEEEEKYSAPGLVPVEAEWTGYRSNADINEPRPDDLSEAEHYSRLMSEVSSDVTILYLHGGAFYLCDPCTHRVLCSNLARLTRGRCLSVRYRLAPQHPFPCALLDVFLAYVSLLAPAPGSFHSPVPASQIVICGDSAGGNLAIALLQLLLYLQRSSSSPSSSSSSSSSSSPNVRFNRRDVPVPLPAGIAVNSAWMDLTRCMPSTVRNAAFDYLPPPLTRTEILNFAACDLWPPPTDTVRGDLYCDTSMLCHPLVSPLAAKDWRGACPMWFGYGQEMLLDEGKAVACLAAQQDVSVVWEEWEAMPHCFALVFFHALPQAKKCLHDWAKFCTEAVDQAGKPIRTTGIRFGAKYKEGEEAEIDVKALGVMNDDEVKMRMKKAMELRAMDHEMDHESETEAEPELQGKISSKL